MNDTTATPPAFAVIATRLPYIDRRALSQAWFSALHLASGVRPSAQRASLAETSFARSTPVKREFAEPATTPRPSWASERAAARAPSSALAGERSGAPRAGVRGTALQTAVRFAARDYTAFQTSLTVGVDKHRVQLLLRRNGGTLHVIALCSGHIAPLVQRALTRAEDGLRSSGEAVRASVRTPGAAGNAGA